MCAVSLAPGWNIPCTVLWSPWNLSIHLSVSALPSVAHMLISQGWGDHSAGCPGTAARAQDGVCACRRGRSLLPSLEGTHTSDPQVSVGCGTSWWCELSLWLCLVWKMGEWAHWSPFQSPHRAAATAWTEPFWSRRSSWQVLPCSSRRAKATTLPGNSAQQGGLETFRVTTFPWVTPAGVLGALLVVLVWAGGMQTPSSPWQQLQTHSLLASHPAVLSLTFPMFCCPPPHWSLWVVNNFLMSCH